MALSPTKLGEAPINAKPHGGERDTSVNAIVRLPCFPHFLNKRVPRSIRILPRNHAILKLKHRSLILKARELALLGSQIALPKLLKSTLRFGIADFFLRCLGASFRLARVQLKTLRSNALDEVELELYGGQRARRCPRSSTQAGCSSEAAAEKPSRGYEHGGALSG